MAEKKTSVKVPEAYLPIVEDIRLLKSDENNPNKMTIKLQSQVWRSLQKYGWTYPIITNKEGVFADGEQRASLHVAWRVFCACSAAAERKNVFLVEGDWINAFLVEAEVFPEGNHDDQVDVCSQGVVILNSTGSLDQGVGAAVIKKKPVNGDDD